MKFQFQKTTFFCTTNVRNDLIQNFINTNTTNLHRIKKKNLITTINLKINQTAHDNRYIKIYKCKSKQKNSNH